MKVRDLIGTGYTLVEDLLYVTLGLILSLIGITLIIGMFVDFSHEVGKLSAAPLTTLLDHALLVLLIVELLYTVQVSFKSHTLQAEPFLIIGLISAIRRVLVLSAQMGEAKGEIPNAYLIELAVLAFLILVIALALIAIRKYRPSG